MRYQQSAIALRRIRQAIFRYADDKADQADRVLLYLKQRKMRDERARRAALPTGPYSGLSRRELRATGTCETDWY